MSNEVNERMSACVDACEMCQRENLKEPGKMSQNKELLQI